MLHRVVFLYLRPSRRFAHPDLLPVLVLHKAKRREFSFSSKKKSSFRLKKLTNLLKENILNNQQ